MVSSTDVVALEAKAPRSCAMEASAMLMLLAFMIDIYSIKNRENYCFKFDYE